MSQLIVHVTVRTQPGTAAAFVQATRENARHSREEPGVVRFDLLQAVGDPDGFLLVEVYRDAAAAAAHKETAHYQAWRDTVAGWMATPRTSLKFAPLDPPADPGR